MNKATTFFTISLALMAFIPGMVLAGDWQYPQAVASNGPTAITVAPGAITSPASFFNVTSEDVGKAVANQIKTQGVEMKSVKANLNPGTPPVLYSADHALQVTIQGLQVDPQAHRWQGQAYIVANGKTETIKPVAGTYEALLEVPVLNRELSQSDVIEASDITTHEIPERQLHKDTITDAKQLIGKSPRRGISPERPIRNAEIMAPIVIKKGQAVEMTYTTPYVHIRADGEALEDGSAGALIRVKNSKSAKAVNARVISAGHVEANSDTI